MKKKAKQQKPKVEAHLGKEVDKLADQVVTALRSSVTRKEVKAIGGSTLQGMRNTASRLVNALRKDHEGEAAQSIKSQTRRVLDLGMKETHKSTKNLRANLAKGLQKIGQELQNMGENLRKK